ncbi:MAG: hypothetical protein AMXMBFR55_12390 [Gemmatimonadota bacterium]
MCAGSCPSRLKKKNRYPPTCKTVGISRKYRAPAGPDRHPNDPGRRGGGQGVRAARTDWWELGHIMAAGDALGERVEKTTSSGRRGASHLTIRGSPCRANSN